jgi:hypothetical protein
MKPTCPDEETVAGFLEARLSGKEKNAFEKHLSSCQTCTEELAISRRLIQNKHIADLEPIPPNVTDTAVDLVSKQMTRTVDQFRKNLGNAVKDIYAKMADQITLTLSGNQFLVAVRGSHEKELKDMVVLKKAFQDISTEIVFMRNPAGNSDITVRLMNNNDRQRGLRLTLIRVEREIRSDPFNQDGSVMFEDVPRGSYTLVLNRNGTTLDSYAFKLVDS